MRFWIDTSKIAYIFLLIGWLNIECKESKSPEYLKYVKEITNKFAEEMKKEFDLYCFGSGGSMPFDVEEIDVSFISYRNSSIQNARIMEVIGIQKLLNYINSHEKIRPYLREYPFNINRVGITISFRTETDDRPLDGSVAFVCLGKNKIFYDKAEIVIDEPTPLIYMNKEGEVVKEMIGGGPREALVTLFEEPYEEALTILHNQNILKR